MEQEKKTILTLEHCGDKVTKGFKKRKKQNSVTQVMAESSTSE